MYIEATALARTTFYGAVLLVTALSLSSVDTVAIVDLWDKLEHAGAYAVLALLGARAYPVSKHGLRLGAALIAWGTLLELLQRAVPGRFCDGFDILANAVGVVLGLAAARIIAKALGQASTKVRETPDQKQ